MDLNDLAVFAALARTNSFSEAARELDVTKSSVSRSLARLEKNLGVRLVHRTTRHVSLSTAGLALHERVAPLLVELQKSAGELPELEEEPSGLLRITATADLGASVLSDAVARFVARHPAVRVELHLTTRLVDLVAEGFDLALRVAMGALPPSSLMARKVGPMPAQLFAAPSYLARKGTPRSPEDLADHDFVLVRGRQKLVLHAGSQKAEVKVEGRVLCDDMVFVREALRRGSGVGTLPLFLAEEDVAAGRLVRVVPKWSMTAGTLWLVWPGGKHVPRKVAVFRDLLFETLQVGSVRLG